jgi:uncharacterized protein YbbC (DUF1343 family)
MLILPAWVGSLAVAGPPAIPWASPAEVALDPQQLGTIDREVSQAICDHKMAGCVVLVGRHGKIALEKAYGQRQLLPQPVCMTLDTVFDLASLTKPVATATSIMLLVERGVVGIEETAARHVPELTSHGKQKITLRQLLTHTSGLTADNSLSDYGDGPQRAWERIFALRPIASPGSDFIYSDVGYLVLGEVVHRASGKTLHEFSRQHIFQPLGMNDTGFLPPEPLRRRAAPTEQRDGRWIQGEVHDPRAFALGGIAGHAGLFSTARDLAVYAQMLLGKGQYQGVRILRPSTVEAMTGPYPIPGGLRGLGWDIRTGYSSNRGQSFSARAFGHGGFTGTSLWIDPDLDLFVIFLSSRLHPDGKGVVNPLIGRIGTIAANAVTDQPRVLAGIDVLQRDDFAMLRGRRIGLIANHTGVNCRTVSTAKLLHEAPGVALVALFSPEHGVRGQLDSENVKDDRDPATGLIIYSLYGKTRSPTPEMLRGIDTLVFDIQDIGTRFYTYISTMGYAMQAAAAGKLRFVVLDRPNPIGGRAVAGPVLDSGRESFIGFHRLPIRHGMTVGELAMMFNAELRLGLDLQVVRVEGWRRADLFDATGMRWINPSPNMRSLRAAILYPGIGLLETTNLSVGRGTETPFEILGAPWIDGRQFAGALNRAGLRGVRFEPACFTPRSSKFANEPCRGVRLAITDPVALDPVRLGLTIAYHLHHDYQDAWDARACDRLLGSAEALKALLSGKSVAQIEATWQAGLEQFLKRRDPFLIYR